MNDKKTIAVWFSCGAASAVAAKLVVDKYESTHNILIVNNPINEEHNDNRRFLKDVEKWIGHEIIEAVNPKYPNASIIELFDNKGFMGNRFGAPCTLHLKKGARYDFEKTHDIDWHVLGFTIDEVRRHDSFVSNERENVIPILIDEKITKGRCFEILEENNIELPEIYKIGFPNANCIGCVKSSGISYWNLVRKRFPDVFKARAKQSREIGAKLVRVKGIRIFLDELDPNEKGQKIKSWECGIFCDPV